MTTQTYGDGLSTYRTDSYAQTEAPTREYRSAGELIFLWLAWAIAFAFWALTMSSFFGIFRELSAGAPGGIQGGGSSGGGGMLMAWLVGIVVLGAGLAWGMGRDKTRDRSLDATTEASTAALYDGVARDGGDDMVSRSPEAREAFDRETYRPA